MATTTCHAFALVWSPTDKPGREWARKRLRLGVNESTRALEGVCKERGGMKINFLLLCKDVRPIRLVEHLYYMARNTGTPFLVLPTASKLLGEVFGLKSMAAMAICPVMPAQRVASRPISGSENVSRGRHEGRGGKGKCGLQGGGQEEKNAGSAGSIDETLSGSEIAGMDGSMEQRRHGGGSFTAGEAAAVAEGVESAVVEAVDKGMDSFVKFLELKVLLT